MITSDESHPAFIRDLETGAILNNDVKKALGMKLAKENRQETKDQLEKKKENIAWK